MGLNSAYASTIPAVFKLVESVLNIIIIILVAVTPAYTSNPAAGWILFVAILSIIVPLFFYIIHLTNVIYKLSGPLTFIEFMCITITGVFQFVCIIVAAATTGGLGTIIATAVLHGISFAIYGVDAFFLFALYKVHGGYLNNPSVAQPQDYQQQQMQQQQQQQSQPEDEHQFDYPKFTPSMFDNPAYAQ
ncbi:hypothetical protein T265_06542 [Opisthorchis viverrini]|uniref:MARVEL domain-containing protein n=2 Tax=Opisthorchis viverrini TaxID=6198 RepID=A0A074ZRZ9_OPIVI|nr:hypothetical protein T265_06542 [Opisthorchis viverrini]KER26125.1 hypothetical protein T265_06542 [Opisthorchis viverrini]